MSNFPLTTKSHLSSLDPTSPSALQDDTTTLFPPDDSMSPDLDGSISQPLFATGSPLRFSASSATAQVAKSQSNASAISDNALANTNPLQYLTFANSNLSALSAGYQKCINAVEAFLHDFFHPKDSVTVTIKFDEQALGARSYYLTNNTPYVANTTFANLEAGLPSSDVLPATDPGGATTSNWYVPPAYGRALGITSFTPPSNSFDATVTLNSDYAWNFNQDVIAGLLHELSEGVMGRVSSLGQQTYSLSNSWTAMDLFRYTASGVYDTTNGKDDAPVYFSSDGGATIDTDFELNNQFTKANPTTSDGVDAGDWIGDGTVFGGVTPGSTLSLAPTEVSVMQALGWNTQVRQDAMIVTGDWEDPTHWNLGYMPLADAEDAYIGGTGSFVNASFNANVTVNSIGLQSGNILDIGVNAVLIALHGTKLNPNSIASDGQDNDGQIIIEIGAALEIGDEFSNRGRITVGYDINGANTASLDVLGALTLEGGGSVTLGAVQLSTNVATKGEVSGGSLTNVDNSFSGIGDFSLDSLHNETFGLIEASKVGSGASAITFNVGNFTNDGTLAIDNGCSMAIGVTGASRTLTNHKTLSIATTQTALLSVLGSLTLNGGGTVALNGSGSQINGSGLTNVDNTISGSGSIDLSAFDNQAGGTIKSTVDKGGDHLGPYLQIEATSYANEGQIDAIANARLAIGNFGTQTFNNSGSINLGWDGANAGSGAQLQIDGNLTFAGAGTLFLRGAGAEVVSGYFGASTLINQSNVIAQASAQIGDAGVYNGVNNLTFANSGTVKVTGGVLTLNTGNHVIDDGGGVLDAEQNGTLIIDSSVSTGQSYVGNIPPFGGTIEANGGVVQIGGAVAVGPPVGQESQVAGQVLVIKGEVDIEGGGGSVGVPITIFGGALNQLPGGVITSSVNIGAGGTLSLDANSGTANLVNVSGNGGVVQLTRSQVNLGGGSNSVDFVAGPADAASLLNTGSNWDVVSAANGATGTVYLDSAISQVWGGGDVVYFWNGQGDAANLVNTGGVWDTLYNANGATGTVYLTNALAGIAGGGDTINYWSGAGDAANISSTGGVWDNVYGANGVTGTTYLSSGQAQIWGGAENVVMYSGTNDAAHLLNTGSAWDVVTSANGAKDTIYVDSALAQVWGGGQTIDFWGGSGNAVNLLNTGAAADTVASYNGAKGTVYLSNAAATISGGGETVDFHTGSSNVASLTGNSYALVFDLASFGLDTVNGFGATDSLVFANADQGHLSVSHSGANTLVTLDANDVVTLANYSGAVTLSYHS